MERGLEDSEIQRKTESDREEESERLKSSSKKGGEKKKDIIESKRECFKEGKQRSAKPNDTEKSVSFPGQREEKGAGEGDRPRLNTCEIRKKVNLELRTHYNFFQQHKNALIFFH